MKDYTGDWVATDNKYIGAYNIKKYISTIKNNFFGKIHRGFSW